MLIKSITIYPTPLFPWEEIGLMQGMPINLLVIDTVTPVGISKRYSLYVEPDFMLVSHFWPHEMAIFALDLQRPSLEKENPKENQYEDTSHSFEHLHWTHGQQSKTSTHPSHLQMDGLQQKVDIETDQTLQRGSSQERSETKGKEGEASQEHSNRAKITKRERYEDLGVEGNVGGEEAHATQSRPMEDMSLQSIDVVETNFGGVNNNKGNNDSKHSCGKDSKKRNCDRPKHVGRSLTSKKTSATGPTQLDTSSSDELGDLEDEDELEDEADREGMQKEVDVRWLYG